MEKNWPGKKWNEIEIEIVRLSERRNRRASKLLIKYYGHYLQTRQAILDEFLLVGNVFDYFRYGNGVEFTFIFATEIVYTIAFVPIKLILRL